MTKWRLPRQGKEAAQGRLADGGLGREGGIGELVEVGVGSGSSGLRVGGEPLEESLCVRGGELGLAESTAQRRGLDKGAGIARDFQGGGAGREIEGLRGRGAGGPSGEEGDQQPLRKADW